MSTSLPAAELLPPFRKERRCLIALLVLAALLRLGVIYWKSGTQPDQFVLNVALTTTEVRSTGVRAVPVGWERGSLAEDRDLYWGIAFRLVAGDGYAHPQLGHATAYRPPLFPLLLAGIILVGGGPKLLAAVQIGLGVATVWLAFRLALKLGLRRNALVVAAFVALNPLLIQATAQAMTETLCAFLVLGLLTCGHLSEDSGLKTRWLTGALFGLAALCRPTVWAFGVLAGIVNVALSLTPLKSGTARRLAANARLWGPVVVACWLVVAPWVLRNWVLFGRPILTTTHGGYTLLLGNNDQAFAAEIARPSSTPWDSREFQQIWNNVFRRFGVESWDEVRRDAWMSEAAMDWIRENPRKFAASCWLRVKRFWNIFPSGADAGSLPSVVRWGLAVFFLVELLAAAVGLWRLRRDEWRVWWPLVLLVLSFALVHVVYWSNLRMRAPVEPVLALLAARGLAPRRSVDV